ncbi:MAG: M1 family metallopeptidase [Anaerolineaceae bacterium]|nr:M1 family metallopeptidase [Anaerolineaceae bacterium]
MMQKTLSFKLSFPIFLAFLIFFTACTGKANTPTPDLVATSVQQTVDSAVLPNTATPDPSPQPQQTAQPTDLPTPQNRTHYQLNLLLNYYSQVADVSQTITYTNRTGKPLEEIVLAIPPKNYPDSYRQKLLNGQDLKSFTEDGQITRLSLNKPLEPGAQTQINLEFRLVLPKSEGTYGVSNRQTNLFNWYPYIPPYDAEKGWLVHPRVVINENQIGEYVVNEMADFDVTLKLTDRANLIEVAASAPAVGEEKNGNYSYHLGLARSFAFSLCDSYFEQELIHHGTRIRLYLFFNQLEQGKRILEIAAKALDLYGELWMPYPRDMLSIVAADFLHNMEMDGMVMLSYGVIDNAKAERESMMDYLVPHEIAHQWFYSLVHNDQAVEPWLDEAIATYSESLFYERYYPDLLAWWWTNRVDKYTLSGFVDAKTAESSAYSSYRDAVYLRGAQFLRELRKTMGDEAFFAALKEYFDSNLYGIGSSKVFFEIFRKHSNANIQPVLEMFFQNAP